MQKAEPLFGKIGLGENSTGKGLAAIYRQEIIEDVMLFTSQSAVIFYDKLFTHLNFTLPGAVTGRRGFPKEAMVCAFIVMKRESFSQITDLVDYLNNNRLIAHYCGFNIMEPLPSYWTCGRFLRRLNNGELKKTMAEQVKKLYTTAVEFRQGLKLRSVFRAQSWYPY